MEDFNQFLFRLIFGLSHRSFLVDYIGAFLAQYLPYLLVLGFLVLVFSERGWRKRLFLFFEAALAVILSRGILTETIRFVYPHPRPFDALDGVVALIKESGSSFPSGHATFLFALGMIIFYFNRRWGIWFLVFAGINGLARIFAGVHWPLDVFEGALVGLLSGLLIHYALKSSFEKIWPQAKLPT
jgi:undecaprenyl-diphosphatase